MTARTRTHLKQEFQNGERPSGEDFSDAWDSFLSIPDDGVSIQNTTLVVNQGLRLGSSGDDQNGTMRFDGTNVQIHDGTGWQNVGSGSGGGGAFGALASGDVAYTDGNNVGIGASFASSAPTFRFEVDLADNSIADSEKVRFGRSAIHQGTGAFLASANFSHVLHANNTSFGFRQNADGQTFFNSPTNTPMFFTQGGNSSAPRLTVVDDGRVVVGSASPPSNDPAMIFQVDGEAGKPGGGTWLNTSDARTKDEVQDYRRGLEALLGVRPVSYRYNGKGGTPAGMRGIGIVGQEVEAILPETVSIHQPGDPVVRAEIPDLRIYDANPLIYVMVNAIKELAARVEALEEQLDAQGGKPAGTATH